MPDHTRQTRKNTNVGKGSGVRRRHRGRTVLASGSPRSHHADHQTAPTTYSCGDTAIRPVPTNSRALAPFRVTAPTKAAHRHGVYRKADHAR